jgi:hypothetical protein
MKIILLLGFFVASMSSFAQDNPEPSGKIFTKENAFVGGSVSLSFGSQGSGFSIGANPFFGYTIKKWFDAAGVVNFQYNNTRVDPNNIISLATGYKTNSTLVGLGLQTRIYPFEFGYLQIQPELNYIANKYTPLSLPIIGQVVSGTTTKTNYVQPSLLVGGGYKRGFTRGRSFAYVSILFDIINSDKSPYRFVNSFTNTNTILPIYRVGVNFSLDDMGRNRQ